MAFAMIGRLTDRYPGDVIRQIETIDERFRDGMKRYTDGCHEDAPGEFAAVREAEVCQKC